MYTEEGSHWIQIKRQIIYFPGEAFFSRIEIAGLEILAFYWLQVSGFSAPYVCTLDGKGHAVSFQKQDPDFPSSKLELDIVILMGK
jgi:hypothetical protein